MSFNHAVIWIDHVAAYIQHFDADASALENVISKSTHPHLHVKAGTYGSGRASENVAYFDEVVTALGAASAILIVGPASEKFEFQKYLVKKHLPLSKKIIGVEIMDHPTDGEVLKYARKYFKRVERLQPTF